MCDILIYNIMKPEQFHGDDHCFLPDINQFYFTLGHNDFQYSSVFLIVSGTAGDRTPTMLHLIKSVNHSFRAGF